MDQRAKKLLNSPKQPSMLLALIALAAAFALPFILVKTFPEKHRITYVDKPESIAKNLAEPTASPTINKPILLPATPKPPAPAQSEWKIVKTKTNDTLLNIFNRAGLSADTYKRIMQNNQHKDILTKLKPNEEIQFLVKNQVLEKLIIPFTTTQYLIISREGKNYHSKINVRKMNSHNHFLTASIQGTLYGTAKRNNIPYKLMSQMAEIFTWDIDFTRDIRAGDQFTIIYQAFYIENKLVSTGDIIAVSLKNNGKIYQAVRHTDRAGHADYYTPEGKSLKKAFIRYPVRFSHISSTFSLARYHPILHYTRPHKGIDLAARLGTPIQATGDGRIEIIGRQNAYGNMIKIKHNNTYSSLYGHMLKFQKGLSRGDWVKKGQIIGYVGQTGLASGPHCHYEFHINNQPKNPATIDLPRGNPLAGRELIRFKANSNSLLAQLKNYEQSHSAGSSTKK